MVKIFLLSIVLLNVSCSSGSLVTVAGLERVSIVQKNYQEPQFYIKPLGPESNVNRSIASNQTENRYSSLSLKQMYFLSLWQQAIIVDKFLGTQTDLSYCPQFHNDILVFGKQIHQETKIATAELDYSSIAKDTNQVVFHPILSLPYEGVDLYSYLVHSGQWHAGHEHAIKSLTNYQKQNQTEIKSLCESGTSPDYYIMQNLVTYYSTDKKFINSTEGLKSILKVNPISNMLIINELTSSHTFYSLSAIQEALISKLNVPWFKNYLYELTSMRNNKGKKIALKE
jgi:hypothetical protein